MMWAALTACFVVFSPSFVAAVIWAGASVISFLQPILIPVAIRRNSCLSARSAGDENVSWSAYSDQAIALVFANWFLALGRIGQHGFVPTISVQSANFARQIPSYI